LVECILGGFGLLLLGALLYWAIWAVPYCDWKRVRGTYDTVLEEQEEVYKRARRTYEKYTRRKPRLF
jgi:hypothetical protein